ncbi:type IV/VI secretion system ImpK/VasF family protein [Variovorax boronicumulans]|uniref:type IVB secretion system protein IcmH/DotU n=1 Tax=Variovorax boronicumulans TaxID=436515 RepID=UPI0024769B1E|nr:type IVB secretion system protein IcmH/DotU [Variovorax boronicumulans]MDH6168258.1 type IV/VI secretion system ImpK/VasF family protein [Variovorax boronicumulans]
MPLLKEVDIAVRNELEQVASRLIAKANPPPPPKPVLQTQQVLARQSPQPDRLVAVRAAASRLFEAAGSLLDALPVLVRRNGQLDATRADKLHRQLVSEIISFQSICQDAGLRYEHIVIASYALCTALDEFASDALRDPIDKTSPPSKAEPVASGWMAHSLAVRFHGDAKGGENIFLLIGRAIIEPDKHIDLLELFFVILRLGFEGVYRHASNGRREMDRIQHRIHDLVNTHRRDGPVNLLAHWQQIERSLDTSSHAAPAARPQGITSA